METATVTTTLQETIQKTRSNGHMRKCQRCAGPYDWRRSRSSLKMTYCGTLCEIADLGFSIESILRAA